MKKEEKTNVMRILDSHKVPYKHYCYADTGAVSGSDVVRVLGEDPARAFKTLVTVARSKKNYVFVIPVDSELDLKKAAACAGEKSVEMIKQKELLPLTGYVHGGCSPIGMKKLFPTFFDRSAENFETVFFSAGKIGYQVEVKLSDIKNIVPYKLGDVTKQGEL
ncbi:MAG: Cys-tRNA(Pro) deacylase [Clostridiales bacterium]|nr:Cys-tRNA(Pro) deacylase [Clostridiales bacterium]